MPIIGRCLSSIPSDHLVVWASKVLEQPALLDIEQARAFELEPTICDHLEALTGGRRTFALVIEALQTPADRLLVTAAAYVLWCGNVLKLG